MSTPTTADIRTWARANGHTVSDRGAIPAAVKAAFTAATGDKGGPVAKAPARKAPAKKTTARKAPTAKATSPAPTPLVDKVHERISALEHQVAALIATIEGLVKPSSKASAKPAAKPAAKKKAKKKR